VRDCDEEGDDKCYTSYDTGMKIFSLAFLFQRLIQIWGDRRHLENFTGWFILKCKIGAMKIRQIMIRQILGSPNLQF